MKFLYTKEYDDEGESETNITISPLLILTVLLIVSVIIYIW
jgi:preprotein translocase subunit Sec61beta